ncbi:hypothetical protein KAR91_04790 [Candidatus Pacearchaeota archaeon]|nr:hypothetical protein [Candidatus Pacearchaeota archaeon]
MPQHALNMLENLIENGSNDDSKVLAEGVKASLSILAELQPVITDHVNDKDLHTPKGLLIRAKVIGWAVFIMFLVATIVMYIPDGILWIKNLP